MAFDIDHERFVAKNKRLASANEYSRRDRSLERKGFSHLNRQQEASCYNCKMKRKCPEFRAKTTGGTKGVVSYGGNEVFVCDKYEPAPLQNRSMSRKQIKSLMKNFIRSK